LLGLMVILGDIWLLTTRQAEATVHFRNPCAARISNSDSWISNFFVLSILVLGIYVMFGSMISNKVKDFIRPRRRR
jgi:predicted small integral membrane protein